MITVSRFAVVLLFSAIACAGRSRSTNGSSTPVRLASPDPVVACAEWVSRAIADPEIAVERVPEPVAFEPLPIPKRLPKGVVGKDGKAEVRIRVLVDTMGVADMRTFTVVKSTHATLTRSVRAAVAKWKFVPAEVGGCKVPRNYNWAAVTGEPKAGDDATRR